MELVNAGVVTNRKKSIHKGKIIAGFIIGSQDLYRWVDDNPLIELLPTEYVNNPFIIAKNHKMVAINSAIEVDLTGQVCSDSIGPKFFSGVGGQMDFIYGASMSEGGLPIIALPSTTTLSSGQTISKLVTMLKPGAGVVTSRNHVHYIATEYGMVNLYGKSIRQRTKDLISIAHPDFREELLSEAGKLHYI
jgi:acetyl-CoA hydrolase